MDPTQRPHLPQQSLPPITAITHDLPQLMDQPSPLPLRTSAIDPRDSGNWSQSKHSSTLSNNAGIQLHSILNAEDSPSRSSMAEPPLSARVSAQHNLPSLNQSFDPRTSLDAASLLDSRRSSVDSRMNVGMTHLAISPSSPYDSQNVSRVSLVSNLQQQRGINTDQRQSASGPLSPLGQRNGSVNGSITGSINGGLRPQVQPRRAPVINPNPRSVSGMPDPTAAAPTKGYPWAFPDQEDPDEPRRSSSSSVERRPSRQNSFAASAHSSIYTTDSMLPPGQKRFSDEMPDTHHHSLQHRSVSSLQSLDPNNAANAGSYSRTPELRISHKMAERKRRSEMKNLFDELNGILPSSAGGKSSKWEVLTKAIEHINNLKRDTTRTNHIHHENDQLRRQVAEVRQVADENRQLREEATGMWQSLRRLDPSQSHVYGAYTNQLLAHEHSQPTNGRPVTSLPPIQQNQWTQGPNVMQGVEYPPAGPAFDRR